MANNSSPSKKPKHILALSTEEKSAFLASFDRVYSDIDGVIWTMDYNVPNAADGYAALERAGKQITYVTNNSVRGLGASLKRFDQLGMQVQMEQIWHPAQTLILYLQSINFDGLIYIIATPRFKKLLREAGYQLIDGPQEFIEETYEELARNIFDRQPVRAVVIDVDFNLTSVKLLRAHIYLRHPECLLLTGATDRLLPVAKDVSIIGPGPFASVLVEASGKEPLVMGKPGRELGNMLMRQHKIKSPDRVLMVGDMLAQDVKFGRTCGFQTLLVLSGGCTLAQLQAETAPDLVPDYYADSMADFVKFCEQLAPKAHV